MNNIQCGVSHTCPVQVALHDRPRYDRISAVAYSKELIQLATIELITYAPNRDIPYRVVGACARTRTPNGELILASALRSRGDVERISLTVHGWTYEAEGVVLRPLLIEAMLDEAGIPGAYALSIGLADALDKELWRLERERAGRAKLLAKLLQVTI